MPLVTNQTIMDSLDEKVFGHLEAKKALITMLNRSRLRYYQKYMKEMDDDNLVSPMKVLLIAASGTGKTHLVESLQSIIHFPFVRVDATQMNPAGSSGGIKPEKLRSLIIEQAQQCCVDYPNYYFSIEGAVDRTVVFVDEVDKLGTSFESSGNWNKHVQSNFLTMFDNKCEFSGISFIFAGAFTDITKKEVSKESIGFTRSINKETKESLDEQILKCGLIPELLGRINYIVELDKFTEKDLLKILNRIIIPRKLRDLAAYGLEDINITEMQKEEIVVKALKSGQGVRLMQRELDKMFLDLEYEINLNDLVFTNTQELTPITQESE